MKKLLMPVLFAGLCVPAFAGTSYDWPAPGGTLTLGLGETALILTDEDVAAVEALGAIVLDAGNAELIYTNAATALNLTAPVSGNGKFRARCGKRLILNESAEDFTGQFMIESTPTCVSNRFGLGSSKTGTAVVTRGTAPDYYFLTFGGEGLTNEANIRITTQANGGSISESTCGWRPRFAGDTAGTLVFNGTISIPTYYPFVAVDNCQFNGGLEASSPKFQRVSSTPCSGFGLILRGSLRFPDPKVRSAHWARRQFQTGVLASSSVKILA